MRDLVLAVGKLMGEQLPEQASWLLGLLKAGPYGVAIIFMGITVFLWRAREELRKENAEEFKALRIENKATHDAMVGLLKKVTEVVTEDKGLKNRIITLLERQDR